MPPSANVIHSAARLSANWDAALAYDVLDPQGVTGAVPNPIFVGRNELLGALVNAISQPDRRGTYLVSGYRGVGKTTLIIEAARRAKERLPEGWRLLPLVLNVSEVSASLAPASESTPPRSLEIDARKLLTALLRALRNSLPVVAPTASEDNRDGRRGRPAAEASNEDRVLAGRIVRASRKAEAASYEEREQERAEENVTRTLEARRSLEVANLLRLVAVLAALAAGGLQAVLVAGSAAGALQVLAVALAGGAAVSFGWARKMVKTTTRVGLAETAIVRDNSLHQLESDLKDILLEMGRRKWRTVIVLEELDKVDDEQGGQLEAVIRYFKNLFTQAPALFFFVTDKQYYDHVNERILAARRNRTYAVEHTFFTHRVFVNRPSVEECLSYLEQVLADDSDRAVIEEIRNADRLRVRSLEDMTDRRERFIRLLLFRAQGHFFDLKNELRWFVQVSPSGESWLRFDEDSLPLAEEALAAFQFLIEQKVRAYRFGGGGDYGNEVLRACLWSVFGGLGSAEDQDLAAFLPRPEDQLSFDELRRVENAVRSLVDDLERGGAIERLSPSSFRWQPSAAVAFRPVATLEPHEQSLASALSRMASIVAQFGRDGPLAEVASVTDADLLAAELRADELRCRQSALPVDVEAARDRRLDAEKKVLAFLEPAREAHRERLHGYGLALEPAGGSRGTALWSVGHPYSTIEPAAPVVLVYGDLESAVEPIRRLASQETSGVKRAAVVVVEDVPRAPGTDEQGKAERTAALPGTFWERRPMVSRVPLAEDLDRRAVREGWGETTADELVFAGVWAAQPLIVESSGVVEPRSRTDRYWLRGSDGTEDEFEGLPAALERWVASSDRYLVSTPEAGLGLTLVGAGFAANLGFASRPVAYLPASELLGIQMGTSPAGEWTQETRAALWRLVRSGRVIVGLDRDPPDLLDDLSGPATRLVDVARRPNLPGPGRISTLRRVDDHDALRSLVDAIFALDRPQASALLHRLAEEGDLQAMAHLAVELADDDPDASRMWEEKVRRRGDPDMLHGLAVQFQGLRTDRGGSLLRLAADQGSGDAMIELITGLAMKDPAASQEWEQRLRQEHPDRLIEVARRLENVYAARAVELYQSPSLHDDPEAMVRLVVLLSARDPKGADAWLTQLASRISPADVDWYAEGLAEAGPGRVERLRALVEGRAAQPPTT